MLNALPPAVVAAVADPIRLAALESYGILDTPPEQGFDDIVQLAMQICGAPVALISLVAAERQWFKARAGFPPCETGLNASVCAHALIEPDLLVIPNLATDPRTRNNPLVTGDPYIQFYAGAPLRTLGGQVLGSLCVIDRRPRPEGLAEPRQNALRALARQVVTHLELRRAAAENKKVAEAREAVIATQRAVALAQDDLDTILGVIVAGALRAFPNAEGAVIELREGDELVYRSPGGVIADCAGLRVPLRGSLAGACLLSGKATIVPDVLEDARVKRDLVEGLRLRSCVLVPVLRCGEAAGVLKLQSSRVGAFTETDLTLAQVLAGSATTALAGEALRASGKTLREAQRFTLALLELGDRLRDLSHAPEMIQAAAGIVGRALDASRVGFGALDAVGEAAIIEADWTSAGQTSVAGQHRLADYGDVGSAILEGRPVIVCDVRQDRRTAAEPDRLLALGVQAMVSMPVRKHGRIATVLFVHDQRPRVWKDAEIAFMRAVADRLEAGVARARAQEHQLLLNSELSHRMKNLLAMVQAIATQTMRTAADVVTAQSVLSGRLIALGRAHDLLMGGALTSTEMEPVIRAALAIHSDRADRFRFVGPAVIIGTDQALSLALTMHELATNAAKYGALSTPRGEVAVEWAVVQAGPEPLLRLSWSETGGPPVTPPARKGFGTRFIERGLAAQVDGTLTLEFPASGLLCTLTATLIAFQRGT